MVEVGQVEHLKVHAFGAGLRVRADLGRHLTGRASEPDGQHGVRFPAERGGSPAERGLVLPADHCVSDRVGQRRRIAAGGLAGFPDAGEGGRGVLHGLERDVVLVGMPDGVGTSTTATWAA